MIFGKKTTVAKVGWVSQCGKVACLVEKRQEAKKTGRVDGFICWKEKVRVCMNECWKLTRRRMSKNVSSLLALDEELKSIWFEERK